MKKITPALFMIAFFFSLTLFRFVPTTYADCDSPPQNTLITENIASINGVYSYRKIHKRSAGIVQITGKDLKIGQTTFPARTPADPSVYVDPKSGEVSVYGSEIFGSDQIHYITFKNVNELLYGGPYQYHQENISHIGPKEGLWDMTRLSYRDLESVYGRKNLAKLYQERGIDPGSDLYFGGIPLTESGEPGKIWDDNWRRRLYPIAKIHGVNTVLTTPLSDPIAPGTKPNLLGHSYGANFRIVNNAEGKPELWLIHEKVTRQVQQKGKTLNVTEEVAQQMLTPFSSSKETITLQSATRPDGTAYPAAERANGGGDLLIEGGRPESLKGPGVTISGQDDKVAWMVQSAGDFTGKYGLYLSYRIVGKGLTPIGPYTPILDSNGDLKNFGAEIAERYGLGWLGRGDFVTDRDGKPWMVFHAVDKKIRPDGAYDGKIPADTEKYHRNIYAVPIEYFTDADGKPSVRFLTGDKTNPTPN